MLDRHGAVAAVSSSVDLHPAPFAGVQDIVRDDWLSLVEILARERVVGALLLIDDLGTVEVVEDLAVFGATRVILRHTLSRRVAVREVLPIVEEAVEALEIVFNRHSFVCHENLHDKRDED